jgi:hypothetical protein
MIQDVVKVGCDGCVFIFSGAICFVVASYVAHVNDLRVKLGRLEIFRRQIFLDTL